MRIGDRPLIGYWDAQVLSRYRCSSRRKGAAYVSHCWLASPADDLGHPKGGSALGDH